MKLTFQLRFRTKVGQSLFLLGDHPLLGGGRFEKAIPLHYCTEESWSVTLDLPDKSLPAENITYNYILRAEDGTLIYDWGNDKSIALQSLNPNDLVIIDSWNHAGFIENAFYTEPFKKVLLRSRHTPWPATAPAKVTHHFKVKAPLLERGQTLCLLGDGPALGNWNIATPVVMSRAAAEDYFTAALDLTHAHFPLAYKYGIYDTDRRKFIGYEGGVNRSCPLTDTSRTVTIVNDGFAALPSANWKGAGIAIPVFSLRSENSGGIGEFADLKLLADWCRHVGLKLIQILPINDTTATFTWTDSYPYAAISAFALNPVYLNLQKLAGPDDKPLLKEIEKERKRLNALDAIDYDAVLKLKFNFLKQIFPKQRKEIFRSKGYQEFFAQNQHWLLPYAAFCHLRDTHGTSNFNDWPAGDRVYRPKNIAAMASAKTKASEAIAFYCFVQYQLHLQLVEAVDYAHSQGVVLKGDIAIGVNRCGVDAWQAPELYYMNVQAGAPPDDFGIKGQNWGFPTYNWERMKQDGYAWWKQRFEQMSYYFDAFRIDHILGFFRIWSVPLDAVEGILGYFVPAIPVEEREFGEHGITFDRKRFVQPYITHRVVEEIFGADAAMVKLKFLDRDGPENYSLKPAFATQRQVEAHFSTLGLDEKNQRLQLGLFDLITNVLLFDAKSPGGAQYHFRFGIELTTSFKSLNANLQSRLKDLYINYFFRRQDDFWMKRALEKLPALKRSTNMLICGEDLGMVPACVPDVMKNLGLLSLEVQRMPKDPKREFADPKDAPYLSVVTPSTHDMSTIRGWWEEDPARTQKFYNTDLAQPGHAPATCEAWINKAVLLQHLDSPAMWSIFQLQDLLGMDEKIRRPNPADERINVPINPKNYWRYRMHLTLEDLIQSRRFNDDLREIVGKSAR